LKSRVQLLVRLLIDDLYGKLLIADLHCKRCYWFRRSCALSPAREQQTSRRRCKMPNEHSSTLQSVFAE
jgi:hypothetical protein